VCTTYGNVDSWITTCTAMGEPWQTVATGFTKVVIRSIYYGRGIVAPGPSSIAGNGTAIKVI